MPAVKDKQPSELERIVAKDGLEKYFENLIAEKENVRPEDVTEEYIRRERAERKEFSAMRYHIDSGYGGYTTKGLEVVTREEIEAAIQRMTEARKTYGPPPTK